MSEDTSTTATSEGTSSDAGASAGGSADGGAGGTEAAEQLAAERDALQAEARRHQAERDRVAAERDRLKRELAAAKGTSSDETPAAASGLTAEQIAEQVRMEMRREATRTREIAAAEATAREQYPNANPEIFARVDEFDSAEALVEAVRSSHEATTSLIQDRLQAAEKELRERYEKVHGPLPEPAQTSEQTAPAGTPSIEELSAMNQAQLDALEKREPGVIDRVLRSAQEAGSLV